MSETFHKEDGMKEIALTKGYVALVDDEDYEELNQHKWHVWAQRNLCYAIRTIRCNGKRITVLMHREILNASKGYEIDHQDHNGLNNQKSNLRLTTQNGNQHNRRKSKNNTSGYKGVSFNRSHYRSKPYEVSIAVNGDKKCLGLFATPIEAALAYDTAARELHGEFACLNFPDKVIEDCTQIGRLK